MHGLSTYQNKPHINMLSYNTIKHTIWLLVIIHSQTLSGDMVFAHDSLPFHQIPFLSCRARPTLAVARNRRKL